MNCGGCGLNVIHFFTAHFSGNWPVFQVNWLLLDAFDMVPSVWALRSLHPDWTPGLHPVLQPGHGGLKADCASGESRHRGCVVWLVLGRSLAVLQPGGGQQPAANVSRQNHPDEAWLWFWDGHAVGSYCCQNHRCAVLKETLCSVVFSIVLRGDVVNKETETVQSESIQDWFARFVVCHQR